MTASNLVEVKTYGQAELLAIYLARREREGKPAPRPVHGRYESLTDADLLFLHDMGIQAI